MHVFASLELQVAANEEFGPPNSVAFLFTTWLCWIKQDDKLKNYTSVGLNVHYYVDETTSTAICIVVSVGGESDTLYLLCVTNGGYVYARMESGSGNGDRTMLELLNQLDGFEASNKNQGIQVEVRQKTRQLSLEFKVGIKIPQHRYVERTTG